MKSSQIFLLLFFSLKISGLLGQQQFQITYRVHSETQSKEIDYCGNGGYLIWGSSTTSGSSFIDLQKLTNTFSSDWSYSFSTLDSAIFPVTGKEMTDGNVLLASTIADSGTKAIHLMQTDSSGIPQWSRKFSSSDQVMPVKVKTLSDGTFYLCGKSISNGAVVQSDILLSRFTSDGHEIWSQILGGNREDIPSQVIITTDDQIAIAGTTSSFSNGSNFFLCKLDTSGNYYWFITYILGMNDTCRSIIQTNDGGYLMVGTGGTNGQDILIMKTDANGFLQFSRTYDLSFSSNSLNDDGFKILNTSDGGIAISGTTCLTTNQAKFLFLIKLSQNLVTEWFTCYGFQYTNAFSGIIQSPDNGFILLGNRRNSVTSHMEGLMIKSDSLGVSHCHETSLNLTESVATPLQFSAAPSAFSTHLVETDDSLIYSTAAIQHDTACYILANSTLLDVPNESFRIFPNPFSDQISFSMPEPSTVQYPIEWRLEDMGGKLIVQGKLNSFINQDIQLKTTDLKSGVYILSFKENGNKQPIQRRAVCIQ